MAHGTAPNNSLPPLSVSEKASLTSGGGFWTTKSVDRAGIPSITMTDGPHGLRKQDDQDDHLGIAASRPATCFPPAVALGSSWDPELAERVAMAIADEAAAADVSIVLGPGVNIKRSPLCGRNFEYFSEDPLVSGVLGAAMVRGLQSRGIGASVKHFAANNQESDRLRVSADIDPRPLREIYLRAFQRVVEEAQPWTVMCSYNRLNGVYASEHPWLLTDVLRGEWGFDGVVVSDWGAVQDRVAALRAGLDLEMPTTDGRSDEEIVAAIEAGDLTEDTLDLAVGRLLDLLAKTAPRQTRAAVDFAAHHDLAREAAARSMVLLKNDDDLLPLRPDQSLAVIGHFAVEPRYQGSGSSRVNASRVDTALDGLRAMTGSTVSYSPGFTLTADDDAAAGHRRSAAAAAASGADIAVVFVGLHDAEESEGFDREHLRLPAAQLALIDAVVTANPRTVVVVSAGSAVELPFADHVPAVVGASLLGQAGGSATAAVLFGAITPSGKLAETFPVRLEDTPAFGNFPGEFGHVRYGEGIFVGYRWYDARDIEPRFPFGHGLSYTHFDYGPATAVQEASGDLTVRVAVTNAGDRSGREIVQLYLSSESSVFTRPPRELAGFAGIDLEPGEKRDVEIVVPRQDLASWDVRVDNWRVEGGVRRVEVGSSSRDIRSVTRVDVADDSQPIPLTLSSSVSELLSRPETAPLMNLAIARIFGGMAEGGGNEIFPDEGMQKMAASFPVDRLFGFRDLPFTRDQLLDRIAAANRG